MPTLHVGDALLVAEALVVLDDEVFELLVLVDDDFEDVELVFDELVALDALLDVVDEAFVDVDVDEAFVDDAVLEEGTHCESFSCLISSHIYKKPLNAHNNHSDKRTSLQQHR